MTVDRAGISLSEHHLLAAGLDSFRLPTKQALGDLVQGNVSRYKQSLFHANAYEAAIPTVTPLFWYDIYYNLPAWDRLHVCICETKDRQIAIYNRILNTFLLINNHSVSLFMVTLSTDFWWSKET